MSAKGAPLPGAAGPGRGPPEHLRTTRAGTKASSQPAPSTPQKATKEKKKTKALEAKVTEADARKTLEKEECLDEESPISSHSLLQALKLVTLKYSTTTPQGLAQALQALVTLMQANNNPDAPHKPTLDALTLQMGEHIEGTIRNELNKLSTSLQNSLADHCKTLSPPETLTDTVSTLKQVAIEMGKSITEATTATTQISDTAQSYRNALLNTNCQAARTQAQTVGPQTLAQLPDPELLYGLDKKARQVLLDTSKGEDSQMNIYELKEKAMAALNSIAPPRPPGTEVQEVIKLRNGSILIQFINKKAADWLRVPENEAAFTRRFDPDTNIRDCVHPIMVPRVPLTFNPDNPTHLREVEEVNRMPINSIKKARWIKPKYRRTAGQSCAHAILSITSAAEANKILKDGIYICSARTFPKKLKFEPKQCMKCRKWGHFAANCRAEADTCGTCGGQHRTKDCKINDKRFCVPCRSNTHTSWDRNCPEFIRKCEEYSGFHPENNLTYFPTDEDWTLTTRPSKLPYEDKFPAQLAVGSLPLPDNTARQPPTRPIAKRGKRSKNTNDINFNGNQPVIENFFDKVGTAQQELADLPPMRANEDDDDDEVYASILDTAFTNGPVNLTEDFPKLQKV